MPVGYLDTNVLIHYLTNDDPQKADQVRSLIEKVERGTESITTSELVIAEVVYILSSKKLYNLPRPDICTHLSRFLRLKGLQMRHKKRCLRALALYESVPIDFSACFIVASVEQEHHTGVISFDTDYDCVPSVQRTEP